MGIRISSVGVRRSHDGRCNLPANVRRGAQNPVFQSISTEKETHRRGNYDVCLIGACTASHICRKMYFINVYDTH